MDEEVLIKYKKAGEVNKKVKELAKKLVKPGAKVLNVVEEIEEAIKKEDCGLAFPLNFSINENAAHYTPDSDSTLVVKEDDLIKIDIGVHFEGYIADSAITLSMNQDELHLKLIKSAEAALDAAISTVKPGVSVEKIGEAVENKLKEFGFKPIENLTGHGLDQYSLHAGLTIPNVKRSGPKLEEDQAIAIEPFSTNGAGSVVDTNEIHIYEFLANKPSRLMEARRILQLAEKKFYGMPFSKRWLEKNISKMKLNFALRDLVNSKALYQYPVLKEKENGLIAQAEHTIIVQEEPIVTTK